MTPIPYFGMWYAVRRRQNNRLLNPHSHPGKNRRKPSACRNPKLMPRSNQLNHPPDQDERLETLDWIDSFEDLLYLRGQERATSLLKELQIFAQNSRLTLPVTSQTPYVNTIPADEEPEYPGDREAERRIKSLVRWNAMAMVVNANRNFEGIGGHISTFASLATLTEVGQNHFFRGQDHPCGGDVVYFQGHASPGNYARAFLEGRLTTEQLERFRREAGPETGLSSYPHPWLMPDFWQFPTVSMGLGPIMAIYHARFLRYLEHREIRKPSDKPHREQQKVWCFLGDGETDEPETLAALSLAARSKLDNLIFVVNCNLQRLDGPVRGNGKIIQELEAVFRGVGWNTIKVIWGKEWDELLERDTSGRLAQRMGEVVDGEYQKYGVMGGAYIREHFYGKDPELAELVEDIPDEKLWKMRYGGHDPGKVYAAYDAAVSHEGDPTVILAKTIKGYGLGEAGEGRNVTHQQKKLNDEELLAFRKRFDVPIPDSQIADAPFYRPKASSPELAYLKKRRKRLGGFVPERRPAEPTLEVADETAYEEFFKGTKQDASTTMVLVRLLAKLLKDDAIGSRIVPIISDEARTFGMESFFRQIGIYAPEGQLYEPVDSESMLYYKESQSGQLLEEGITEAGCMGSFIAAGTSGANHGLPMIPFFLFYSMFGPQRVGDLIWAAGDSRARGFLVGATAGRTTLNGEGLQHQDGHSHLLTMSVPNLLSYDTTYAYEVATIMREGIRRMYGEKEPVFYYLTVGNEKYAQPEMPDGAAEGILKGMYPFREAPKPRAKRRVQLLGSGSILNEVVKAQKYLAESWNVHGDVWAVTSYQQLHRDALEVARSQRLQPEKKLPRPYVAQCLTDTRGPVIAASDYMKALPDLIASHLDKRICSLGTDGYGRSDTRETLRDFFEVDYRHIALAALHELQRDGLMDTDDVVQAREDLKIDPDTPNPAYA